jgi:hypothetical protein
MDFQACCEDDRGKGLHPPLAKDAGRTGRNWTLTFLLGCVVARPRLFTRAGVEVFQVRLCI